MFIRAVPFMCNNVTQDDVKHNSYERNNQIKLSRAQHVIRFASCNFSI